MNHSYFWLIPNIVLYCTVGRPKYCVSTEAIFSRDKIIYLLKHFLSDYLCFLD